jgi:hypothetical protein
VLLAAHLRSWQKFGRIAMPESVNEGEPVVQARRRGSVIGVSRRPLCVRGVGEDEEVGSVGVES